VANLIVTGQLEDLAAFYAQVIGRPADMVDDEQGFRGWQVGNAYFSVLAHSGMQGGAKDPGRLIFNFETPQVQEEFARIKGLGAQVIRQPYAIGEGWIATLADPDGNYFQLTTPMG
jgi:predicted enzyme related to lactoylglutathione lyase